MIHRDLTETAVYVYRMCAYTFFYPNCNNNLNTKQSDQEANLSRSSSRKHASGLRYFFRAGSVVGCNRSMAILLVHMVSGKLHFATRNSCYGFFVCKLIIQSTGNFGVYHPAIAEPAKGHLQGQRGYHRGELRQHLISQRQEENDAERNIGDTWRRNNRQLQHWGKPGTGNLPQPELSEVRQGDDDAGRDRCHGRRQVYLVALCRQAVFLRQVRHHEAPRYKYLSDYDKKNAFDIEK